MDIKVLIQIAATLTALAVLSGRLREILREIRASQVLIVKNSQASGWDRAMLISVPNNRIYGQNNQMCRLTALSGEVHCTGSN